MKLTSYSFDFPKKLIATKPASPRDSAKLLVYDRTSKKTLFDTFLNLANYLPKGSVIVFNQTKVIPARLLVQKPTGGIVELLYLSRMGKTIHALLNKKVDVGTQLSLTKNLIFIVTKKLDKGYELKPSFPLSKLDNVLNKYGKTPLPPYIKDSPLSEKKLREEYQTVFSRTKGSVAAPTASLHFSKRLLQKLKQAGIQIEFVTLHVGLGTFAPVTDEQIKNKKLHKELYEIDGKSTYTFSKVLPCAL
jgi:S-adenosylmethionine:tRNA ribosyltransferase-isomerase